MPRKARVVTTCCNEEMRRGISVQGNIEKTEEILRSVAPLAPDLVCLPEIFLETGVSNRPVTDTMTEEILEFLSARAKDMGSYLVASCYDWVDGKKYNMAWLINRDGNLVGKYGKYHPTIGEIKHSGVTPGSDVPVFKTDFGVVGMAICYDIGWPSLWSQLGAKGAELVVWPSAYDGGFPLQAYAWSNFYYVVSSVRTNHSKIIDKTGRILTSTSRWHSWACDVIDLEKEIFHIDQQYHKLLQVQERLGAKVTIDAFSEENIFVIESNDSEWPISRIKEEFGLESYRDYHRRAQSVQDDARVNR